MQSPVIVLNTNVNREHGQKAQIGNIMAAKAVADIVRTTLGPRSMLKMLLDAMGGIVLTNDGNAILREIDVSHPAAKSMIELSRAQDEEVGDGTTSVIILAGEMLSIAEPFIERKIHPTVICRAFSRALDYALTIVDDISFPVDTSDHQSMLNVLNSCIGTKFTHRFGKLMSELSLKAVQTVCVENEDGKREIDLKKFAKVEKVPGGTIDDSYVLSGVMFNKDIVHPKMRRHIVNPRILLLDCPIEYKKGENQTNVEINDENEWESLLKMEELWIESTCARIAECRPDVIITEKGISDLACHYLHKYNITAIRRIRKTDNNRIARACNAKIVNRPEEIKESDVGVGAGLFEVKKIGDEYFTFIIDCAEPKACTILLRGASKDTLNEVERNLQDAMGVARNVVLDPRLVAGGGAVEMSVSRALIEYSQTIEGVEQWPFRAVGQAFEVIPRTLAQNCGANVIRTLTKLRSKHAEGLLTFGVNGNTGDVEDIKALNVWEPYQVKIQTFKTSIEAACMLLRIDDIVSGLKQKKSGTSESRPSGAENEQNPENPHE